MKFEFHDTLKVSKEAKFRNRYTQVPHLTQDTTKVSGKIQQNTAHRRAKMLAVFQQLTTRLH